MKIIDQYYLSRENNLVRASKELCITKEEIEEVVGRFRPNSHRHGKLRGQVVLLTNGQYQIRHHFKTNLILWES